MGTFVTGIPSSLRTIIPPLKSTRINISKVIDPTDIIFGSLYNGYAVNDTRFIANIGWRVPTIDDFAPLSAIAADTSPFSPSAIGYRTTTFVALDTTELVWGIGGIDMAIDIPSGISTEISPYNSGYNVRLLKNVTTLSDGQTSVYVGNDGTVYNTICIGTQEWLSENLIETKYRNGDIIPIVTDNTLWIDATSSAMCYYDNDILNSHTTLNIVGNPTFHIDVVGDNGYSAMGVPISRTQPLRFNNLKYGTYTITEQSVLGYTSSVLPATVVLSAETPMWDVVVNNTVVDYNRLLRLTFNEDVTGGCIEVYGSLYNWYAATDARLICADGWEVPTNVQLQTLSNYLGGDTVSGGKLKETGNIYWTVPNTGATNETAFNGRGGGYRKHTDGTFTALQTIGQFRLSDAGGTHYVLNTTNDDIQYNSAKATGSSIRLVKSITTLSDGDEGVYTGNDGKNYRTICIGTQEWLADNLYETKYRNGDWIHGFDAGVYTPISNVDWGALTSGAMCYYDNDVTGGCGIEVNYGSLYNGYAATDARGIAPSGWHVPSYAEWQTLATTLGGIGVAGGKMKEAGTTHWSAPNTGADNSSGFNALPAGTRTTGFQNINLSTAYNSTTANATEFLSYVNDDFSVGFSSYTFGCSIRLIKDNSTDTGTVTDYDGNIYPTVKIGTQVWMAENLIVEHFNNGDAIPNVTDDTAWGALATSGMCYYDNDVTNSYIDTSDAVSTYIGGDATLLSSWNTFFNLPTNGHEFTSISIDGGIVSLNSLGDVETKINQFLNCTLLTNVYDNGVIIYLGSNTFNGCSNLITTSIAKCASIDEYAFYYCQAMTTVHLPIASTMAQYAFYGCKWLSSLDIPYYAYTSIEPYVFTGCESITSFRFDNVTNVSEGAFANCHATSYIIPSLTTAGVSAFAGNPVITSYDFHSLTTAGNWCFYQNDANTAIDFANLTTAGEYCWAANYLVTSVMLPNITTAGRYCFSYLYNVPTFNLGKLVTAGEGAFNNCYLATLFYLPLLTSIGTRGFYGAYACNTVYIPLCTSLGATVGDNLVFYNVAALNIGITIPYMLMTCNSGSPDGDLQYLMANNTVSIQYSDALTVDSTIVTSDKTTYTI